MPSLIACALLPWRVRPWRARFARVSTFTARHRMRAVSLMVMIPAFQAGGPGSIPGRRIVDFFASMAGWFMSFISVARGNTYDSVTEWLRCWT